MMDMQRGRWLLVAAAMVAVLTAVQVQRSTQLSMRRNHPLHEAVDRVNAAGGPYVGLIMAFPLEEKALLSSGCFVPSTLFPNSLLIAGRRFNIGTIRGVDVIYDKCRDYNSDVVRWFDVVGVVHYGITGSTNNSLLIGDVVVPSHFAFTGSWDWQESESSEEGTTLDFGDYNVPKNDSNQLGAIELTPVQLFYSMKPSNEISMEKLFWLPVDPIWFKIATQIKVADVLQRCINDTEYYCLPEEPNTAFGLRSSTADVYLNNAAYRGFLWERLNISTVDEESAAIVMTSLSNGKPCLVFRGISDYEGASGVKDLTLKGLAANLAAKNAFNLDVEFIDLIGSYKTRL